MANGKLPHHCSQPLLGCSQIDCLALSAVQISWKCFRKLVLQSCQPLGRAADTSLVPESDKGVVEGFEECYEMDESTELDCFCGVVVQSREVDCCVQGQRAVALNSICSADFMLVVLYIFL